MWVSMGLLFASYKLDFDCFQIVTYLILDRLVGIGKMKGETAEKIVTITESFVRSGGYNGFSFRDIAKSLDIKSSSVHYHFATKDELVEVVTRSYVDNFAEDIERLLDSHDSAAYVLDTYIGGFKENMLQPEKMCLCGILISDFNSLSPGVVVEIQRFFDINLTWLKKTIGKILQKKPSSKIVEAKAVQVFSLCYGAHFMCRALKDNKFFDLAVKGFDVEE